MSKDDASILRSYYRCTSESKIAMSANIAAMVVDTYVMSLAQIIYLQSFRYWPTRFVLCAAILQCSRDPDLDLVSTFEFQLQHGSH